MAPKGSERSHADASRASRPKPPTPHRAHRHRAPVPVVPGSVPEGVAIAAPPAETPHGHLICHGCGRIAELELTELDRHLLMQLSRQRPDGWTVDGVTFSLTGTCPRCGRESR